MPLFVAGLSHRNAPVELREQLAVDEDKLRELLRDAAAAGAGREILVLSTCNRVEVYALADVPGEAGATQFPQPGRPRGARTAQGGPTPSQPPDADAVRTTFPG